MPRTRKPSAKATRPVCAICETNEAELGTICNECAEITNQHELLYLDALRNPEARKAIKKLTKAERQRIAPTALSEDDLQSFIDKGIITGRHQATVRIINRESIAKEPIMSRTATTKSAPKTTSTRTRRPAGTKAAPAKAPKAEVKQPVKATTSTLSAAQVARDAGIDGRAFRKFLRAQSLKPSTKAQFTKAVAAFKKASQQ